MNRMAYKRPRLKIELGNHIIQKQSQHPSEPRLYINMSPRSPSTHTNPSHKANNSKPYLLASTIIESSQIRCPDKSLINSKKMAKSGCVLVKSAFVFILVS